MTILYPFVSPVAFLSVYVSDCLCVTRNRHQPHVSSWCVHAALIISWSVNSTAAIIIYITIIARPLWFAQLMWFRLGARWSVANPQTKSTNLSAVSLSVGCCCHLDLSSLFIINTQPKGWYSFYHPTEARRLSRPSWPATYHVRLGNMSAFVLSSLLYGGHTEAAMLCYNII